MTIGKFLTLSVANWVALLALSGALPSAAFAQDSQKELPVLLEADRFGYDVNENIVFAEGHAEVVQGEYIVLADRITYDQKTGVVKAKGNVTLAEPGGNVFFSDEAVLKDNVQSGIIANFRARLVGDATIAANEARKVNEQVTEMDYAVFSSCHVCQEDASTPPLWQLKAKHVRYDKEEQAIEYRHARMEVLGVPVLYTPYFSHAAPDADRKSGLLTPRWQLGGPLGARFQIPYYWNIAPEMDAVITPIYTTEEGPVIAGQFRHLTPWGEYSLGGSYTQPENEMFAGRSDDRSWRGHVEGKGIFYLSDTWQTGFDGKWASDDTYLRRYEFGYEDSLTSKAFVQGFKGRSFLNAEAVTFQGLRARDNQDIIPVVHPNITASHETNPLPIGGRLGVTGNIMALSRDVGNDTQRLDTSVYYRLPMVTAGGHVLEIKPQLRADVYNTSDNLVLNTGTGLLEEHDGTYGRFVPELQAEWRYPLIRRFTESSLILEPHVQVIAGMGDVSSNKIPNNDSLSLEFSDWNLFSTNPYPGYDVVEEGVRVNYGIHGDWDYKTGNVAFLVGQNYHTDSDNLFPYSKDLTQSHSDYVGSAEWNYAEYGSLGFRFRMGDDDYALNRSELWSLFNISPVTLKVNYVNIKEDLYLEDVEDLNVRGIVKLNKNWSWQGLARTDLSSNGGLIHWGTGLIFDNECLTMATSLNRQYISDRDVEPNTSVKLQVFLKGLN